MAGKFVETAEVNRLISDLGNLRFDGRSVAELQTIISAFKNGGEAGGIYAARYALMNLAQALEKTNTTIRTELTKLGISWEGEAAGQAIQILHNQADFATEASKKIGKAEGNLFALADSYITTKQLLENLVIPTSTATPGPSTGHATDNLPSAATAAASKNIAINALTQYAQNAALSLSQTESVKAPPILSVQTPAPTRGVFVGSAASVTMNKTRVEPPSIFNATRKPVTGSSKKTTSTNKTTKATTQNVLRTKPATPTSMSTVRPGGGSSGGSGAVPVPAATTPSAAPVFQKSANPSPSESTSIAPPVVGSAENPSNNPKIQGRQVGSGLPSLPPPVTNAPVANVPLGSNPPATGVPVTGAPVTGAPVTGVPITGAPGASTPVAPVPVAPVTGAPGSGLPSTHAPATNSAPPSKNQFSSGAGEFPDAPDQDGNVDSSLGKGRVMGSALPETGGEGVTPNISSKSSPSALTGDVSFAGLGMAAGAMASMGMANQGGDQERQSIGRALISHDLFDDNEEAVESVEPNAGSLNADNSVRFLETVRESSGKSDFFVDDRVVTFPVLGEPLPQHDSSKWT